MTAPDTRIALRVLAAAGHPGNPVVDHPGQPAGYVHTDGTVWTWQAQRWQPVGGVQDDEGRRGSIHLRVYDLAVPGTDPEERAAFDAD